MCDTKARPVDMLRMRDIWQWNGDVSWSTFISEIGSSPFRHDQPSAIFAQLYMLAK